MPELSELLGWIEQMSDPMQLMVLAGCALAASRLL
jgi:hypothetical protein